MKPLSKPRIEFGLAKGALEAMKNADRPEALEEAWFAFLRHYERCWNKAEAHLKRSPKYQGWPERGRVERLRRQDPLLAYLKNARGTEEHTVENITKRSTGGIGINPAEGNSLYIEEMSVFGDVIRIKSPQSVRIDVISGKVALIPIQNRGRQYDVPTKHLEIQLPDQKPTTLAEYGIAFLEQYLTNAEAAFVK